MEPRTRRATTLGVGGTALMGVATWWLLHAAASGWPGLGRVGMDAGLAFLALAAAGVLAGWATVLLAAATTSLAVDSLHEDRCSGLTAGHPDARAHRLTGRIAAGLLVAASLGVAPANATETPRSAAVAMAVETPRSTPVPQAAFETSQVSQASHASQSRLVDPAVVAASNPAVHLAAAHDEEVPASGDQIPVPGWTPTLTGADERVRPVTAEVSLVSTPTAISEQQEVVVHRGDTLWDIAARHLGEEATDEDIAEAWPRWYDANKDVIGADPDLIHPGQRLVVPTSGGAR